MDLRHFFKSGNLGVSVHKLYGPRVAYSQNQSNLRSKGLSSDFKIGLFFENSSTSVDFRQRLLLVLKFENSHILLVLLPKSSSPTNNQNDPNVNSFSSQMRTPHWLKKI